MLKRLYHYTEGYRKWLSLGTICSAAQAIFELLIPLVMADIVDVGIASSDTDYIVGKGILMIGMALVSLCFGLGSATFSSLTGQGFGANLRKAEFDHIQSFAFYNIERFSTASLITRLTTDVNTLQLTLMMGMRLMVRAPVMLIAALFLAINISLSLSRVFLVVIPVLVVLIGLILVKVGPMFRQLQEKTDDLSLVVQENLSAIRVVKSFVREGDEKQKFGHRNHELRKVSERAFGSVVLGFPGMMLVIYGTIIATLWFGGKMVYAGTLPVGLLTTFVTYITQILISLMMVSMMFMMFTRSVACARRVIEVLKETPDITDTDANPALQVSDGSIDFDQVEFRYDSKSEVPNLSDINLHIRSGETIGILGGTASGKSTLISLISRLYDVSSGTVSVGGHNVKEYSMDTLRKACAVVLQQNVLFSGTIRENLKWGNPDADDDTLWAVCRMAAADEFIHNMPDGLDTDLGQGGVNVSGGQKQRLCIARALLRQPKILILDDSTSAVDTATDAKIRKSLADALPGTTKLIIAQRVTSIQDADRILVMDDGKIAGVGTHQELLQNNTIYREIYDVQQKGGSIDG